MIFICEFIKPVTFKNGYLVEAKFNKDQQVKVCITDIAKDWHLIPVNEAQNNPKIREMTIAEFNNTFRITHVKTITK